MKEFNYKKIYEKIQELRDNSESFMDPTEDNDIWKDDIKVLDELKELVQEHEEAANKLKEDLKEEKKADDFNKHMNEEIAKMGW